MGLVPHLRAELERVLDSAGWCSADKFLTKTDTKTDGDFLVAQTAEARSRRLTGCILLLGVVTPDWSRLHLAWSLLIGQDFT